MRKCLLLFCIASWLLLPAWSVAADKDRDREAEAAALGKSSGVEDRAGGTHNAANIGLFFENRGKLYPRRLTQGPSGEFPIGSGKNYVYRINPMVGVPGNVIQGRYTTNEEWEAVGGYHNKSYAKVAFSDNPLSWDSTLGWPVKDSNGQPIVKSDQDSYCVYDDHNNTVRPLGVVVEQTGYAYGVKFAQNLLFFKFQISNQGPKDLDSLYFSLYCDIDIGDVSGGAPEYQDDRLDFDKANNFLYFFDDGATSEWAGGVTGFFGVTLLKTPTVNGVEPGVTDMHYNLYDDALGNYNWGGWQGYGTVHQDAALWFNKGYVDQLTPMHYHWMTGDGFLKMLVNGGVQSWGAYIKEGIAAGRLYSVGPGSYILSESKAMANHAGIVSACRQVPWVDGYQFFSYGSWEDNDFFDKAATTFFANKTKIRAAKFLHDAVPPAPALAMQKMDSLQYQLQVGPPAGLAGDQWFLIYRLAENADASQAELVHTRFGRSDFTWTDRFTGTQDYNKRYTYYATLCDRYWNESIPSPAVSGDPIPSFAPTVLATDPAVGDTVTAKSPIRLTFSKTMDPASFQNALAFQPPVTIGSLLWSPDQRTCTITPAYGFNYGMAYTLQLAAVVRDVNGVQLDGNGDGRAGDGYKLNFVVESRDTRGPNLLASYPAADAVIAPEELLSFVFNEPLAASSLNDNSVLLSRDGQKTAIAYNLTRVGDKTVLSVQPKSPLQANSVYKMELLAAVTDTLGNPLAAPVQLTFRTSTVQVKEVRTIDQFTSVASWKAPSYSGSTEGIVAVNSSFAIAKEAYLPNVIPGWRNAAALAYEWDPAKSTFLLREYMDVNSAAAAIKFDSTYTLQCYLFGDASATLFRFALDDGTSGHEVSQWIRVDWYGWRLVEWKLSDPASFGTWLGDGHFSSSQLNIDSFQLTRDDGSAWSGKLYFDDLRAVRKSVVTTGIAASSIARVAEFALEQNYPNPFNAETIVPFSLPQAQVIELAVYDLLGRRVALLAEGLWPAGSHRLRWDASQAPSGIYVCRLHSAQQTRKLRMMVVR